MQIALDKNGNRVLADVASKTEEYFCPICGERVIVKQGEINSAHFAHQSNECVDSWNYDMSEWHRSMQERFPEEQREVVVKHNGQTHRADILCGNKVIEFQHSPISATEIDERNRFYNSAGYSVAWVFDLQEQWDSEAICPAGGQNDDVYRWKNPKRCFQCFEKPTEYNKKIVIYSYHVSLDNYECFDKIIWSTTNDCGRPDFKLIIFADYATVESLGSINVSDFFLTKQDLFNQHMSTIKHKYQIKVAGVKGHKKDEYVCPRTNKFGIKEHGSGGCSYCRYCAAIKTMRVGFESYCCYPNQVNELNGIDADYECAGIPRF